MSNVYLLLPCFVSVCAILSTTVRGYNRPILRINMSHLWFRPSLDPAEAFQWLQEFQFHCFKIAQIFKIIVLQ